MGQQAGIHIIRYIRKAEDINASETPHERLTNDSEVKGHNVKEEIEAELGKEKKE